MRMKEGDEWKAAFHTNNDIFQDLIRKGVVCIYLDDILIFTKTIEDVTSRITNLLTDASLVYDYSPILV